MATDQAEYALIVGNDSSFPELEEALSAAIQVRRCAGPDLADCPEARGESCPLREGAKVTVVRFTKADPLRTVPCALGSFAPVIGVLEGSDAGAVVENGIGVVGEKRGTAGVLAAITEILDA